MVVLSTGAFAAGLCFISPTLLESVDYVLNWRPSFQFLIDAVREGRIPLWNPYAQLGRPYLADMQNAVFYPPVYVTLLGQSIGAFLLVWSHCLLAVFGMRGLAKALGAGRWQGYFMACSYLGCGAFTACLASGVLGYWLGICYVPTLFHCALRTEEPWDGHRIGRHAVWLALQFLCGHPQVFWFTAIGQAVFIAGRTLWLPLRQAMLDAGRCLCQLAAAGLLCLGLVAVVLLPFLELVNQGNRVGASPAFAAFLPLRWPDLETLIDPAGLLAGVWSLRHNLFVGPVVLLLGLAGLCLVRERNVRGLLAVGVVSLLMALGDRTPCFWLFYKWLPGYGGFRCHQREGLLVVLVLVCATGIWLSRPNRWLRTMWASSFEIPARWVAAGMFCLQVLLLLDATWVIKQAYSLPVFYHHLPDYPFQQTLVAQLRWAGLLDDSQPPPRVCVPWEMVPSNYGMLYRYSSFDAYTSLFLLRPWDYLHGRLGIEPPQFNNTSVSDEVYARGPFPYPDLGLAAGIDPATGTLHIATNPAPRAFLVYAAEVGGDYDTVLKRLASGHDIHRSALLESALPKPLPQQSPLPGTTATILRFEPNWLLLNVDASENALLVLAEAWYPGWRAEIDGETCPCVPANLWMRAVPVPAGRHRVRVYFHQNHLLAGLLISLASVGLLLVLVGKPGRRISPLQVRDVIGQAEAGYDESGRASPPRNAHAAALSAYRPLLRVLVAGAVVAFVWLLAVAGIQQVRLTQAMTSEANALAHRQVAVTLASQHQTAQAIAHYTSALQLKPDLADALNNLAWIRATHPETEFRDGPEAVRLAERACELTRYGLPLYVGTLAAAYAEAGRFEEAVATAGKARDLALAGGRSELAETNLKLLRLYAARQPYREGDGN